MAMFNIEDQMVFYGSYHHNRMNQLIHVFFVPLILFTAMVFTSFVSLPLGCISPVLASEVNIVSTFFPSLLPVLPSFVSDNMLLNASLVVFLVYSLYYLSLDFAPAFFYDIFLFAMYLYANQFRQDYGTNGAWYALGLHLLSWFMQIYPGHIVLEGRKPALTDSFFQSLVLAPLFVWFEILFFFSWRPDLYNRIEKKIIANIKEYKASQGKKQK